MNTLKLVAWQGSCPDIAQFEVGKRYYPYSSEYGAITILRRTAKTIFVQNESGVKFAMRIWHNPNGNEMATDSSVPQRYRQAFTYRATHPERD